ncbi:MAG: hypothetical protein ACFNVM_07800, partial [Neisseria elongata]
FFKNLQAVFTLAYIYLLEGFQLMIGHGSSFQSFKVRPNGFPYSDAGIIYIPILRSLTKINKYLSIFRPPDATLSAPNRSKPSINRRHAPPFRFSDGLWAIIRLFSQQAHALFRPA